MWSAQWNESGPRGEYVNRHRIEAEIDDHTVCPPPSVERAVGLLRGEFVAIMQDMARDVLGNSDPDGATQQRAIHTRAVFTPPEKARVVAWEARVDAQTAELVHSHLQAAQSAVAGKFSKGIAA